MSRPAGGRGRPGRAAGQNQGGAGSTGSETGGAAVSLLPESWRVNLPAFEGPLDLLLHLVKVNKVEITDIPVATICDQFHAYLALMEELNLDIAGEYIYEAALLIHLKSKMLLPRPASAAGEPEDDPRRDLVGRLLEYRRLKEVAQSFAEVDRLRLGIFTRRVQPLPAANEDHGEDGERVEGGAEPEAMDLGEVSLFDLLSAFRQVLVRYDKEHPPPLEISAEEFSVRAQFDRLLGALDAGRPFDLLLDLRRRSCRAEAIAAFLAVLELARLNLVRLHQTESGEVLLYRTTREAAHRRAGGDRRMTDRTEMEAVLEAVLFVSSEPVPRGKLLDLFEPEERAEAEAALAAVLARYTAVAGDGTDGEPAVDQGRGVMAEEVGGGVRLVTRPEMVGWLRRFFDVSGGSKLSMAALETLAIVAYRQPITGPEIQELRSVSPSGVLKTLLEKRLVRIAGRKEVVGKPFLYATTREFLVHFGLNSLKDLPPLEEFEEAFGAAVAGFGSGGEATALADAADTQGSDAPDTTPDREERILREVAELEEAREAAAEDGP